MTECIDEEIRLYVALAYPDPYKQTDAFIDRLPVEFVEKYVFSECIGWDVYRRRAVAKAWCEESNGSVERIHHAVLKYHAELLKNERLKI